VKTAKLRLSALSYSFDGPGVRSAGSNWAESTIKWNNRPARGATAVDDKSWVWGTVEYNVKPLVTGNGAVSFALISTSTAVTDFASREHLDAASRPQLIVTF
jgi:hypothetical protein